MTNTVVTTALKTIASTPEAAQTAPVSQTVEAGTEIPAYSKIYLQISLGPETTPTPSPSPVPTQDPNIE